MDVYIFHRPYTDRAALLVDLRKLYAMRGTAEFYTIVKRDGDRACWHCCISQKLSQVWKHRDRVCYFLAGLAEVQSFDGGCVFDDAESV